MFVKCKYYPYREKPSVGQIWGLQYDHAKYADFYAFCRKIEHYFDNQPPSPLSAKREHQYDEEDEEPQLAVRRRRAVKSVFSEASYLQSFILSERFKPTACLLSSIARAC